MARHVMTARRRSALRKAQLASARKRKNKGRMTREQRSEKARKVRKRVIRYGTLGGVALSIAAGAYNHPEVRAKAKSQYTRKVTYRHILTDDRGTPIRNKAGQTFPRTKKRKRKR